MKKRRITGLLTAMTVLSMCVTVCGGSASTAAAPAANKADTAAEAPAAESAPVYDDEWVDAVTEEYAYDTEYDDVSVLAHLACFRQRDDLFAVELVIR